MSGEAGRAREKLEVGKIVHTQDPIVLINCQAGPFLARRPGCTLLLQNDETGRMVWMRTAPSSYDVIPWSNGPSIMWEVEKLPESAIGYQDSHVG